MEVYVNNLPQKSAEIIVVTYDVDGSRYERKFFLEEQEDGKVSLVLMKDFLPEKIDCDKCAWVYSIKKEKEVGE